jgi:hypothetical protein
MRFAAPDDRGLVGLGVLPHLELERFFASNDDEVTLPGLRRLEACVNAC